MPPTKEAEKLTIAQASLALAADIFKLKHNDRALANLLHPFTAKSRYDSEGIDFSIILENPLKSALLVKLIEFAWENDPNETRQHFLIPQDYRRLTELRFGLAEDGIPKTFRNIEQITGISLSTVDKHITTTVGRLRHPSRSDLLRKFLEENFYL